eukprot:293691_1
MADRFKNLPLFSYKPHYVNLPSSQPFRMGYIDEQTSNYSNYKSEIFICLHGLPVYSYVYRKIIPLLLASNNYHHRGVRVICPDFIGYGRSEKPTITTIDFMYHRNTIIELIRYLNLEKQTKLTIICQGFGGCVAFSLPIHYVTTKYNPIKRIMYFNTTISKYRKLPSFNINQLITSKDFACLSESEINGYLAPFHPNIILHSKSNLCDTFELDNKICDQLQEFWEINKDNYKIKLFHCHGCQDTTFTFEMAKETYQQLIGRHSGDNLTTEYGISSETGGILWVNNGGHFLQESPDIDWVIKKALKYFNDIPYDDVECEWILSKNSSKANIIKLSLNNYPVNVLSLSAITSLNNILLRFNGSQYCDGFILTSNIDKSRKKPIFSAGYDLALFAKKNPSLAKKYFFALRKMDYLIETSKKPIVVGLNGTVIAGALLLCLRCDYRVMMKDCFVAMNETRNGIKYSNESTHDFIK